MAYTGTPGVGRGEAQVFNLAPFYNQLVREQQLKKAENQAIDKQIADDLAKYTPDGLRQQDVQQFLNQYQNLKNLSIQYRDAIRNPAKNPKAWSEYQTAKSRLTGLIAESKAAKENTKSLYDFRAHNLDKLDDDAFKQAMGLYNAPIGSPEHNQAKNFDQSQLMFKEAKFDAPKWQSYISEAVKPVVRTSESPLSSGARTQKKVQYIDPLALSNIVAQSFDNDLVNSKKFYTTQFEKITDEDKAELESYATKYLPGFKINNPKDYAVAANLYGQVEKDMGTTTVGAPYLENQAFQQKLQNQRMAHAEKMQRERAAKEDKDKYIWETNMGDAMSKGDNKEVQRLYTELESSTPGVEKAYLKVGVTPAGIIKTWKRNMGETGVDGKTKTMKDEDFRYGVLVVAVPKYIKDGKGNEVRAKDSRGRDEYEYLAVSAKDKHKANRLNKLKNYALGGTIKPLTDKVYEDKPAEVEPLLYNIDEFSPLNEEEQ